MASLRPENAGVPASSDLMGVEGSEMTKSWMFLRYAHDAFRITMTEMEYTLASEDPDRQQSFPALWKRYQKFASCHADMEDYGFFPLLDVASNKALADQGSWELHQADSDATMRVDRALGRHQETGEWGKILSAFHEWEEQHLAHLQHEEFLWEKFASQIAADPQELNRLMHKRVISPAHDLDPVLCAEFHAWVARCLSRYGNNTQTNQEATACFLLALRAACNSKQWAQYMDAVRNVLLNDLWQILREKYDIESADPSADSLSDTAAHSLGIRDSHKELDDEFVKFKMRRKTSSRNASFRTNSANNSAIVLPGVDQDTTNNHAVPLINAGHEIPPQSDASTTVVPLLKAAEPHGELTSSQSMSSKTTWTLSISFRSSKQQQQSYHEPTPTPVPKRASLDPISSAADPPSSGGYLLRFSSSHSQRSSHHNNSSHSSPNHSKRPRSLSSQFTSRTFSAFLLRPSRSIVAGKYNPPQPPSSSSSQSNTIDAISSRSWLCCTVVRDDDIREQS